MLVVSRTWLLPGGSWWLLKMMVGLLAFLVPFFGAINTKPEFVVLFFNAGNYCSWASMGLCADTKPVDLFLFCFCSITDG